MLNTSLVIISILVVMSASLNLFEYPKPDEPETKNTTSTLTPTSTTSTLERATVHLNDLGIRILLPPGWKMKTTMQEGVFTFEDEHGRSSSVSIEPENYFYHNPSARSLEDYLLSYRGRDIDVVIKSSESSKVGGEDALLQFYSAGDIIDGQLTSRSLASVTESFRYVVQHPHTGNFIIFSGGGTGRYYLERLERLVSGVEFLNL